MYFCDFSRDFSSATSLNYILITRSSFHHVFSLRGTPPILVQLCPNQFLNFWGFEDTKTRQTNKQILYKV